MDELNDLTVSSSEGEAIHKNWSTFPEVLQQLAQEGFGTLPPPSFGYPGYLDIDVVTSHDSRTITIKMAENIAWIAYTKQRLMYSKMILVETKNELSALELQAKRRLRETSGKQSKAPTTAEIQEKARSNPRYEQLKIQQQKHEQLQEAYEADLDRFSKNYALLSRTVTLRGQDIEQSGRQGNVGANSVGNDMRF